MILFSSSAIIHSLSVMDLVRSTRYVSVDASISSNSLLVNIVSSASDYTITSAALPSKRLCQLAQLFADALGLGFGSMLNGVSSKASSRLISSIALSLCGIAIFATPLPLLYWNLISPLPLQHHCPFLLNGLGSSVQKASRNVLCYTSDQHIC